VEAVKGNKQCYIQGVIKLMAPLLFIAITLGIHYRYKSMENHNDFIKLARSFRFNLFMLRKLPSAYFSGVRIKSISDRSCSVAVPYMWFSKNPFRSTYFACLAMAAELSTGALAMANVYKKRPVVSMLVVKMNAEYFKKATGITLFTCSDGETFKSAVIAAVETGEPQIVAAASEGKNEAGELVAKFSITWSFKVRSM
jgi:hypothetical protein